MTDTEAIANFSFYWILFALILFPLLLFVKQPYGRHIRKGWGRSMPNKTAWFLMELPALTVYTFLFIYIENYTSVTTLLASLWVIHYFHRTIIFPFKIRTKGKRMPIIIVVFGFFFNLVNASINGLSLQFYSEPNYLLSMDYLKIAIGLIIFISGFVINIYSDNQLIHLRKSSSNGYQIPQNSLFKWVSCPNYLGEIIEWIGFAIIAWNSAALSFAIWTMVNLIPRAIDHHKWYKNNFENYPKKRRAIFPYFL